MVQVMPKISIGAYKTIAAGEGVWWAREEKSKLQAEHTKSKPSKSFSVTAISGKATTATSKATYSKMIFLSPLQPEL